VVDHRWDAAVWVILGELWGLVLVLVEVEVDTLVRQTEFSQNKRDFPSVGTALVGVQSELLSMGHDVAGARSGVEELRWVSLR